MASSSDTTILIRPDEGEDDSDASQPPKYSEIDLGTADGKINMVINIQFDNTLIFHILKLDFIPIGIYKCINPKWHFIKHVNKPG